MTKKLISAIKYMHELGVVHRDLKPENMLMTDETKDARVKITDFGLSKITDGHSDLMKTPCGTPGYIGERRLRLSGARGRARHAAVSAPASPPRVFVRTPCAHPPTSPASQRPRCCT